MSEEEKEALQDRFSGYQLPKIYLTAGFPSYDVPVHPYFYNQPLEWTKPSYTKYETTGPQVLEGEYPIQPSPTSEGTYPSETTGGTEISSSSGSSQAIIRSRGESPQEEVPRTDMLPF
jgi:hypothetical protein